MQTSGMKGRDPIIDVVRDIHMPHNHGPSRGVTQMMSMTCKASHFTFASSILTVLQGIADKRYEGSRSDRRCDE